MSVFHNNALIGAGGGTGAAAAAGVATKSLRFNEEHSAYLHRTPSSAGNRTTWTWSCWFKRGKNSNYSQLFNASTASNNYTQVYVENDGTFVIASNTVAGGNRYLVSTRLLRDPSAWYHLVAVFDTTNSTQADRMRLYVNNERVTSFSLSSLIGQNVESNINSTNQHSIGSVQPLGTNGRLDGYLADVYFIDGSALDPTSFGAYDDNGVWQAATYSGTFGTNGFHLLDFENESTIGHDSSGNENDFTAVNFLAATGTYINAISGTARSGFPFSQMFDGDLNNGALPAASTSYTFTPTTSIPFSTLHIYAYKDSSPGTLKINGTDVTSQVPNHNGIGPNQRTQITGISSPLTSIQNISLGNLANVVFAGLEIDGELLLDKASEVDVLFDVPTDGDTSNDTGAGGELSSNYATLNPIHNYGLSLSNGNLDWNGGTSNRYCRPTFFASSGKWYCEFTMQSTSHIPGIIGSEHPDGSGVLGELASSRFQNNGTIGYSGANTVTGGLTWAAGDIVQLYMDMDNKAIYWGVNGTLKVGNDGNTGVPTSGASKTGAVLYGGMSGPTDRISSGSWGPAAGTNGTDTSVNSSVNFGARAFAYSAPSGYKPWCTANLPTPTIADGRDHFYALASTGTFGGGTVTDSDANFTPDWVWVKRRNAAERHKVYDILRGTDGTRYNHLETDGTDTQGSGESGITAFVAGGYTSEGGGHINSDGQPFISWMWNAGTSTVSNTDGDITTNLRANATAGFSIATYSGSGTNGDRIGHGLGVEPDFCIIKALNKSDDWRVYHSGLGTGKTPALNSSNAASTGANWQSISSTTLGLQNDSAINGSGYNYVAYFFAAVAGYSAVGGPYTGTGDTSGPFQYCGFRPSWIMIKSSVNGATNNGNGWTIFDTARSTFNETAAHLAADSSAAEYTGGQGQIDILSNGFKPRQGNTQTNHQSNEYFWIAFAENPFQANGGLAR